MTIFANVIGGNVVGWQAFAAEARCRSMAGSAAPRCAFEDAARMAAVAICVFVSAIKRETGRKVVESTCPDCLRSTCR
jgi:hypothetical protein